MNYTCIDEIGVLTLNNPPVNALSHALRIGIAEALNTANNDDSKAIVIIGSGKMFCAGADIKEFGQTPMQPSLVDVTDQIEKMTKPVIAAIHGNALGGGLELALSCHFRCALTSAKLGLPEVKLGILPGSGGTQRTPRIIGVEQAYKMITSGAPIGAKEACTIGLIDHIMVQTANTFIEDDLIRSAISYAKGVLSQKLPIQASSQRSHQTNIDNQWFAKKRVEISKRTRGQIAPQRIIDCLEASVTQPFDAGMKLERSAFMECVGSNQASAMQHLFFAQRSAAKIKDIPANTPLRDIKSVAVIGAGTMGGGIAMNFINVGIPVHLLEINAEQLKRGIALIDKNYAISVSKGRITEAQKDQCMALITATTSYQDLDNADLVIEAVFEDLAIKRKVFTQLDKVCKPGAILATNTSYQDVDLIAQATTRPQDVIGLHFFSPANVMKLLEVVRGSASANDVIATSMALSTKIGKIPVLAGVCYGFIGNRMLNAYIRQSQLCLMEGATPEQIDNAMQSWGAAMGPLSMSDLAGIDIGYKARQGLTEEQRDSPEVFAIADAMFHANRLGQKTGAGYYTYNSTTRQRMNDPEAIKIIEAQSDKFNITRKTFTEQDILNRLLIALVNEGANVLHDGIAQRSSDIDVVYTFGYGFPVHQGGPMHWADTLGTKRVYDLVCDFAEKFGDTYWRPSPLLKKLAETNQTFKEWDAAQSGA